jgi:hypothetical protein
MPEKVKIILTADTRKAVHGVGSVHMGVQMKKSLWKVFLFSGMFLLAAGSVCVSCVSAPDAGNAKHDISVNAGEDLNGDIFTYSVFTKITNVLLVDRKDRSKKMELSAADWSYNQDTTRIVINRPVPFSTYMVSVRGEAAFPYSYVLNGIVNLKNMYVILNDRLAIDGYDYTFDSGTNRLTFRSDININDCKWYITYDMESGSVALSDRYSGDKESDRLGYFEAQHRKEYLDSWYDSQDSFWFFSDSSLEGQKPMLVKRAATPVELQAMKSFPVSVMKFRMKTTPKKLSRELGYKVSFPRKITLPEYNAQYTTDFQTIEEYSEAGKLVKKLYVFYELTSGADSSVPQQLGLYILPPDAPSDADAPEKNMIINSDTVDIGGPVARRRSWALFSEIGNDLADEPSVVSQTQWSWHTPHAEYMLESDSMYEAVCESFIRQFIK